MDGGLFVTSKKIESKDGNYPSLHYSVTHTVITEHGRVDVVVAETMRKRPPLSIVVTPLRVFGHNVVGAVVVGI